MFNWFKKKEPKITAHNVGETTIVFKLRDGSAKTRTVSGYAEPWFDGSVLLMRSHLLVSRVMNNEWIRDDEGTCWNRREIVSYESTTKDKFIETQEE